MVKVGKLEQYGIYWVNLDPSVGSEINKKRPCVIISPNEMNDNIKTVVIAPLTSTLKAYPTRFETRFDNKISSVALDQIRTLDKIRFNSEKAGELIDSEVKKLKEIMKITYVD